MKVWQVEKTLRKGHADAKFFFGTGAYAVLSDEMRISFTTKDAYKVSTLRAIQRDPAASQVLASGDFTSLGLEVGCCCGAGESRRQVC
jgi:hypothetical protein